MCKRSLLSVGLFLFFSLTAIPPAGATTVIPPENLGHLARISRAVVFAQALELWVEEGDTLPYTVTRFQLVDRIAGSSPGTIFEVREPGGAKGRIGAAVEGAPRFREGKNYLLFLDPAPTGRWRSKAMAYGLLVEIEGSGLLRPLPQVPRIELGARGPVEPVGIYRKTALLQHLKEVARGARWNRQRVEAYPAAGEPLEWSGAALHSTPAGCAFLTDSRDGLPIRWFGHEDGTGTVTVVPTTPGQTGIGDGGVSAVQQGVASWASHAGSAIRFVTGDPRPRNVVCSGSTDLDQGSVVFDDPCDDLADLSGCVGTLAFGGTTYDNLESRLHDGEPWHPAMSPFVIVNDGAECVGETSFKETLAHELGHALGFGHHTPPDPAQALMSAKLKGDGLGAALRSLDKTCASYAYHTFRDVPLSQRFWAQIEALENAGITNGCSPGLYCPDNPVTRAEMAAFLVRASHGSNFEPPPASGTVFQDVPASFWAARFIEQLYRDGVTNGCRPGFYCPGSNVLRSEMAAFLVRARYGSGYVPPPATGTVFEDVPASYWAARYIEQLYRDGVTNGCSASPRRYCPGDLVTRDQMAVFLARAFSLPLP